MAALIPPIRAGKLARPGGRRRRALTGVARCADGGRGRLPGFEAVTWIGMVHRPARRGRSMGKLWDAVHRGDAGQGGGGTNPVSGGSEIVWVRASPRNSSA